MISVLDSAERSLGAPVEPLARAVGPGRVLGVFLALAAFVAGIAWLASGLFVPAVDGAAKQREYFGERPPPFGLALESALSLSRGARLVRFERASGTDTAGTASESGSLPEDVLFLEPTSRDEAQALLRAPPEMWPGGAAKRIEEWQEDKSFELLATRKSGEVVWGEWSAKLLIVRAFAKGGPWRDEARVDLSSGARALVLLAHWPPEVQADEAVLRALLGTLVLTPSDT